MAYENATYISDLDPANPDGKDPIAEGDNHIRNIKGTLLTTFPNVTGEVTSTHEELNELSGLSRLPDAPASDGSMLYSSGGKWVETSNVVVTDTSLTVNGGMTVNGQVDVDSLTVNGVPLLEYTTYTAGNGISVANQEIAMTGSYSGTFTAGNVVAQSDARLKEAVSTAPRDVIAALHGREWVWKESGKKDAGVIAQELEEAGLEHLVHTDEDGMKSVSYNGLFAYVIEELKALREAYERDCK